MHCCLYERKQPVAYPVLQHSIVLQENQVGYEPYENPEITVTSVIPFGYSSGNAVELSGLVYAYLYDPDVLENTTITGNNALSD